MGTIEDPWNSRPIDVHRWSDHPEVAQLVDRIWDGHLQRLAEHEKRTKSEVVPFNQELELMQPYQ